MSIHVLHNDVMHATNYNEKAFVRENWHHFFFTDMSSNTTAKSLEMLRAGGENVSEHTSPSALEVLSSVATPVATPANVEASVPPVATPANVEASVPPVATPANVEASVPPVATPVNVEASVYSKPSASASDKLWRQQSVLRVRTNFITKKQRNVSIRPKHQGMQVVFPAALNSMGKTRVSLSLPTVEPFGVSPDFAKFVQVQLQLVVNRWRTQAAAQKWVGDKRQEWKTLVIEKWRKATRLHKEVRKNRASSKSSIEVLGSMMSATKSQKRKNERLRTMKKSKRRLELDMVSPTVYSAKKKDTHSIPIPAFEELLDGHVIDLSIALRVYPRVHPASSKRRPSGILMIPKRLSATGDWGEYSLGTEFGVDPEWLKFVAEYVGYAALRWTSLRVAKRWCDEKRSIFIQCLKQMWAHEHAGDEEGRFWRIGPSNVPTDPKYINAFKLGLSWGFNPEASAGSGLFCTKKGEHKIFFGGPPQVSARFAPPIKKSQSGYIAAIPSSEEVFSPTVLGLQVGAVHHGFIVQHSRTNPTHEAAYDVEFDQPVLVPLRDVEVGEEFTFDYGMDKGEDVASEEDDADSDTVDKTEDQKNTKLDV